MAHSENKQSVNPFEIWAQDVADRVAGDDAWMDQLVAKAMAPRDAVESSRASGARVIAPRGGFRRWQPVVAVLSLAAAAAGVFMLARHTTKASDTNVAQNKTAPTVVAVESDAMTLNPAPMTGANVASAQGNNVPIVAAAGSSVVSVESSTPNETVSVFDVEGERAGSTVAVVWISEN